VWIPDEYFWNTVVQYSLLVRTAREGQQVEIHQLMQDGGRAIFDAVLLKAVPHYTNFRIAGKFGSFFRVHHG